MISLGEMLVEARDQGVAPEVLEKDYCLGWFVYGIARSPLSDDLVLKGGTALRKGYFPDYRFSEDLDFTARRVLDNEELQGGLEQACRIGTRASGVTFNLVALNCVRSDPETPAWRARVSFVGPRGQARAPRRIRLDITAFEQVLLEPDSRPIFHPYSDAFEAYGMFFQLEEILAEKLRTILQRGYPRDVYDVWYIVRNARKQFDAMTIQDLFHRKCAYKAVSYRDVGQFLEILEMKNTDVHWSRTLGMQIRNLPEFEGVRQELETELCGLLC